ALALPVLRGRRIPTPVPPIGKPHAALAAIPRITGDKKPSRAGSETDAQAPEPATGRKRGGLDGCHQHILPMIAPDDCTFAGGTATDRPGGKRGLPQKAR